MRKNCCFFNEVICFNFRQISLNPNAKFYILSHFFNRFTPTPLFVIVIPIHVLTVVAEILIIFFHLLPDCDAVATLEAAVCIHRMVSNYLEPTPLFQIKKWPPSTVDLGSAFHFFSLLGY